MGEDGRVPFSGMRATSGAIEARADLEDVDLRLAAAFLPQDTVAKGRATGHVEMARIHGVRFGCQRLKFLQGTPQYR
jgi:hypothetical protein